jgi:hypothetical protein
MGHSTDSIADGRRRATFSRRSLSNEVDELRGGLVVAAARSAPQPIVSP